MSQRELARSGLVAGILGAVLAGTAAGQDVRFKLFGETDGENFGYCVDGGGDVDGDGVPDLVGGAPLHDVGGSYYGRVRVFSGVDGGVLLTFDAATPDTGLGFVARFAGDVNRDGRDDIVLGFPNESVYGAARVYSGADGSKLLEWFGTTARDGFGAAADGVGDLDGDGTPELLVGVMTANVRGVQDVGSVSVYSGRDGSQLRRHNGGFVQGYFGISVGAMGDADGDGVDDYVIGEAYSGYNGWESGSAYVYSGASGALLWNFMGAAGDKFGNSVDGCGDVDGDGAADFIVGAPLHEVPGGVQDAGAAYVYSGRTGQLLLHFEGNQTRGQWGYRVRGAGDVSGDGFPDLLVGAPFDDSGAGGDGGRVWLYSGRTGGLLHRFDLGHNPSSRFGSDVCGAGDTDGDGVDDLFFGAAGESTPTLAHVGAAYLCRGEDLFLEVRPVDPFTGVPLEFFTRGLLPGDPAFLFLMSIDGVAHVGEVSHGSGDGAGLFYYSVTVPPGLSGHTMSFQCFGATTHGSRRSIVDSIELEVAFR